MHTSGPWHRNIKPARKYGTIFADRNTHVAHLATQGLTDEEVEANCALITAAPELLAALKAIADSVERFAHDAGGSWPELSAARAVIRQAEGA